MMVVVVVGSVGGCGWVVVWLLLANTQKDDDYDDNLDKISHVAGHFLDCCVVERLNIVQRTLVVLSDEVDRNSLTTETATTSNSGWIEEIMQRLVQ